MAPLLTPEGCRRRRERLLERLPGGWDVLVIHQVEHLLYLAGFYPLPNSLNHDSSSYLLIERGGAATLFTDNWLGGTPVPAVDELVTVDWYTCQAPARNRALAVGEAVAGRLGRLGAETVGAELARLPFVVAAAASDPSRLFEIEPAIRELREIKDPDELAAIRRGIRTAEAVHAASRELLCAGQTEMEYYAQLHARALLAAEVPFVMMCDLASGPRAATGGGPPTSRALEDGDLVILDFFPHVEGYRGDITNTLVVGGRPTREQSDLFELVLAGLRAGEKLLQPGTPVREVFRAVDGVFREAPGERKLIHHAGHAIGLGHPEAPELVPESDRVIAEGMVLTLEPGLYGIPSGGVRLEHNYLITAEGPERLSSHELSLI